MSSVNNLKVLGEYSAKMLSGDYDAVFDYFAPEFMSHTTDRINPEAVGTDIREHQRDGHSQVSRWKDRGALGRPSLQPGHWPWSAIDAGLK